MFDLLGTFVLKIVDCDCTVPELLFKGAPSFSVYLLMCRQLVHVWFVGKLPSDISNERDKAL